METSDQTLDCQDCSQPFTFSAGEQQFYSERGLMAPKRCKSCRIQKRNQMNVPKGERKMYDATCVTCGAACKVPFEPKPGRDIYCRPHLPPKA